MHKAMNTIHVTMAIPHQNPVLNPQKDQFAQGPAKAAETQGNRWLDDQKHAAVRRAPLQLPSTSQPASV